MSYESDSQQSFLSSSLLKHTGEMESVKRHLRRRFTDTVEMLVEHCRVGELDTHPCDANNPTASPGSTKLLMYLTFINNRKFWEGNNSRLEG